MKIAVIGSINMDYSVGVSQLPGKGETITAKTFYHASGGKGANQAVAAKRLGADVYMIGAIGKDGIGRQLYAQLEKEGIKLEGIKYGGQNTGTALITVDAEGNNTIVVYPGANADLDEDWIIKNKSVVEKAEYIILQLEIPMKTVESAVKLARQYDRRIILNPAPAAVIPDEVYGMIDIITPNETELAALSNTSDIEAGARWLLNKGVKNIVVTLGEKGCFYLSGSESYYMPAYPVNAIDTTAAGDAFNGALAVALGEGKTWKEALEFANRAGALTATRKGAQDALPLRDEIK